MAHCIERNFFTHLEGTQPPWHGLVHRTHNGTWEDFLSAAQMGPEADYIERKLLTLTVPWSQFLQSLQDLASRQASTQALTDYCSQALASLPDEKALVRRFDKRAFAVSKSFVVHQARQVLEVAKRLYDAGGLKLDTAMWLNDGRMICFSARINGNYELRGKSGTLLNHGRLNGCTGFDGTRASEFFTSLTTIVCMNTFRLADAQSRKAGGPRAKFRHSASFNEYSVREVLGMIQQADSQVKGTIERMEKLREQPLADPVNDRLRFAAMVTNPSLLELVETTERGASTSLDALISATEQAQPKAKLSAADLSYKGKAILDAIVNSPGCDSGQNYFSLVQGATYVASHTRFRDKGNEDAFLTSSVIGPRSKWGSEALVVAERMAAQAQGC